MYTSLTYLKGYVTKTDVYEDGNETEGHREGHVAIESIG